MCSRCGKEKSIKGPRCSECQSYLYKRWYNANREEHIASVRKWQKEMKIQGRCHSCGGVVSETNKNLCPKCRDINLAWHRNKYRETRYGR